MHHLSPDRGINATTPAGEVNRVCFGNGLGGFACSDVSSEEYASYGVAAGDLDVLIFTDGFESGDTSAWFSTKP